MLRAKELHPENILFTGSDGLLGTEFKKQFPLAIYTNRTDFDIENYSQISEYIIDKKIGIIIHAAAFTSPPKVDSNPLKAIDANIIGTSNVVKLCINNNIKLLYISTDYVFRGDHGNYSESDEVFPINKYAVSKLGGECAVKMYDNSLIIRTSFGPNIFPYEKAFIDQWTSRESVSEITAKIIKLLNSELTGIIHIGSKPRTVFEYAKSLDPSKDLKELSIKDINFVVPVDTSLDCSRFDSIINH
ncbi:MAG: sugar nucleotide-binding protein [Candidatus Kapabacteria bacterium]|nr:sugar nucleotide-binding protein [Candidatus Kapabacteria bacterium]